MKTPRPHSCCNETKNLERVQTTKDSYVEVCRVCHAKHTVGYFEPATFGVVGGRVGG